MPFLICSGLNPIPCPPTRLMHHQVKFLSTFKLYFDTWIHYVAQARLKFQTFSTHPPMYLGLWVFPYHISVLFVIFIPYLVFLNNKNVFIVLERCVKQLRALSLCFFIGPEFNSRKPYGSLQLSVKISDAFFWCSCRQNTHLHKVCKQINLDKFISYNLVCAEGQDQSRYIYIFIVWYDFFRLQRRCFYCYTFVKDTLWYFTKV